MLIFLKEKLLKRVQVEILAIALMLVLSSFTMAVPGLTFADGGPGGGSPGVSGAFVGNRVVGNPGGDGIGGGNPVVGGPGGGSPDGTGGSKGGSHHHDNHVRFSAKQ
jgi:hypothetical protein